MIIGKSLTAIVSGGLKPEIIVTAKAGALLNLYMKNSSIILQSYQLGAYETTHTFVVDVSQTSYVIGDVTNNKSIEVLVDSVEQYRVSIIYPQKTYLYESGNKHNEITGDWSVKKTKDDGRQTVTFTDNYISVHEQAIDYIWICPNNQIDVTNFSNAKIEFNVVNVVSVSGTFYNNVSLSVGQSKLADNTTQNTIGFSTTGTYTLSVDISSLTGNQYVVTRVLGVGLIYIYKIWL